MLYQIQIGVPIPPEPRRESSRKGTARAMWEEQQRARISLLQHMHIGDSFLCGQSEIEDFRLAARKVGIAITTRKEPSYYNYSDIFRLWRIRK